jgi:hypothetical protein
MWRKTLALITICCLSQHHCDNRFNDKYNQLVTSDNLKKEIDSQLPKQSKFFDMNDFDCKCSADKLDVECVPMDE